MAPKLKAMKRLLEEPVEQTGDTMVEKVDESLETKFAALYEVLEKHTDTQMQKMEQTNKAVSEMNESVTEIKKQVVKMGDAISDSLTQIGNMTKALDKVNQSIENVQRTCANKEKEAEDTINMLNSVNGMTGDLRTLKDHVKVITPAITECQERLKTDIFEHTKKAMDANVKNFGKLGEYVQTYVAHKKDIRDVK